MESKFHRHRIWNWVHLIWNHGMGSRIQKCLRFPNIGHVLDKTWQWQLSCLPLWWLQPWISYHILFVFVNCVLFFFFHNCLRSAAKAKLPADKLITELKSSLCWKEATLSVIKHVWNEQARVWSIIIHCTSMKKIIWDLTMMKAGAARTKTEKFEKQHGQWAKH